MKVNLAWNLKGALIRYYNSAVELGGWHASSVFFFFLFASSGSHSRIECIARLKGFG